MALNMARADGYAGGVTGQAEEMPPKSYLKVYLKNISSKSVEDGKNEKGIQPLRGGEGSARDGRYGGNASRYGAEHSVDADGTGMRNKQNAQVKAIQSKK
jgi:hypothetical protein